MKGYVYRFWGKDGKLKYIGQTRSMYDRMNAHFGKSETTIRVIPKENMPEVERVEYIELESIADAKVLEIYLIARDKPEWNSFEHDGFTLTMECDYEWKEWELRLNDNPHHHIFVWKDDELLYEIPKVGMVYTCLCMKLGITQDMNFGYSSPVYNNGYKLMRLSEKRRIKTGSMAQRPKYSFMGYPELFNGDIA